MSMGNWAVAAIGPGALDDVLRADGMFLPPSPSVGSPQHK